MIVNYLDQSRIIEHIFAPALNDRGVTGNIAVGCQDFQPIATQRYIASKIYIFFGGKLLLKYLIREKRTNEKLKKNHS